MARVERHFVCQSCGAVQSRWAGKCEACGGWNTLIEEAPSREAAPKGLGTKPGRKLAFVSLEGTGQPLARLGTGIAEFDRVFGGGLIPGSAALVAGDPGIGKSTLLLQAAAGLVSHGLQVAYVSGEEGVEQIRLRARRLGMGEAPVALAAATSLRDILTGLEALSPPPAAVIVDSIQTLFVDTLDSAPGTVAQVRASAHELIRFSKRSGAVLLIVGHVTKEGQIAGPKVLEHMVDTVIYFEGERGHQFRIVRAIKNRFGPTDEIGVFEMTGAGLKEVSNPSALFLSTERSTVSGTAIFAGIEGTRPLLVEVQALVVAAPPGSPRRTVVGWDSGRLAMVLAVLEARAGLSFGQYDVFLNVAGGLRIEEPAADLAVAAALVSAHADTALDGRAVWFGEIGLSGDVRPVSQAQARLKEAEKLGFERAFAPLDSGAAAGIRIESVKRLEEIVARLAPERPARPRRPSDRHG
ncbi:MAG: DNA repair protein RadA [Alphaproteobacteria bacterium]|nr:DNA repair protein RadA [Alphaproteobacteria bacterium]